MIINHKSIDSLRGLDFWRAFLLLMGVLVHSIIIDHPSEWIGVITRKFRMETFFLIAGLLAHSSFTRHGASLWLKGRLLQLGVPLLFGVFFINQIWLTIMNEVWGKPHGTGFSWYKPPINHLWFLVVLTVCSIMHFVIFKKSRNYALIKYVFVNKWSYLFIFTAGLLALFIKCLGDLASVSLQESKIITRVLHDFSATILMSPFYSIYYFWGVSVAADFESPRQKIVNTNARFYLLCIMILLLVLVSLKYPLFVLNRNAIDDPLGLENIFECLTKAAFAPLVSAIILEIALKTNIKGAAVRFIVRGGYTLYIVHWLMIAVMLYIFKHMGFSRAEAYVPMVVCAIILSLCVHYFLVERYNWVAFALNGKTKRHTKNSAMGFVIKGHKGTLV